SRGIAQPMQDRPAHGPQAMLAPRNELQRKAKDNPNNLNPNIQNHADARQRRIKRHHEHLIDANNKRNDDNRI
ncbi:hypothetical protein, partial [Pseudomonas syringae group genomosp. 7]|uniref:hypothetical protein n=1 Tax=Pseudomonas syringae group genomosp. 7 TaxID=251699 RepID=UPI00376FF0A8